MSNKKKIIQSVLLRGAGRVFAGGNKAIVIAAPHVSALADKGREAIKPAPISSQNWYQKAADVCADLSDIFLPQENRIKGRLQNIVSAKLGGIGATAGIFSLASLVGTASTGTAIGSLSGAAATSATLAWLGGSMVVGSLVVGGVALAGSVGAIKVMQWAKGKLYAKKRRVHELEAEEVVIVNSCVPLAIAFRQQDISGRTLDACSAKAIRDDAIAPLYHLLNEYKFDHQDLPYLSQRRLNDSIGRMVDLYNFLTHWLKRNPGISVGVVSAVFLQLLSEDMPAFGADERLVLESLQRSKTSLNNASDEELSEYVKSLSPEQLVGLHNNVKGIYHEKYFAHQENNDGDHYLIELFEATNHPGADVRIIDTLTGDVKEVQLKATKYLSYIREHNEKYADIPVMANIEMAALDPSIESTGISNVLLDDNVSGVFAALKDGAPPDVVFSMSVAAMITLARNIKVLVRGGHLRQAEKVNLIEEGVISAGAAGLTRLIIG